MPDLKISELPAATAMADSDLTPFVQVAPTPATKRASLSQLRRAVLADRGVDVRDFGAVGDGVANDAPAIQAAINALGAAGGTVNLGPRTYRLNSAVTISSNAVRLQGAGFAEGGNPGDGTWLTVASAAFTPITFTGVAARGSGVHDIAVRQSHGSVQNPSWAPVNYDYFFKVVDCLGGIDFDNVMLSGVNRGIFSMNSGRTDFRRIRGQVFTTGIEIDEAFDTCRLMNIHFWPFWSANDNVVRWQQANGDALVFRRVDGVFVDQSFVLGYRSMFRFTSSASGHTQKFSIGQAYADFVRYGLWIDANGTDGQVDAMTTQGEIFNGGGAPLAGAVGVYVDASSTRVQIGTLRVDDAEDNAIRIEQNSNRIDIGALRCVNYNLHGNGAAAIHLAHATAGVPNRVNLGSAPLLETAIPGPLFNAGSNGSVGLNAPAGEAARPGLSIGDAATGLFRPSGAALSAAANGVELLRAESGKLNLGAAPGLHGLEVTTPAGAVNRPEMVASATGAPSSIGWRASGTDANISAVAGQPKGTGSLSAQFPDGTAAGGGARGANAVDWQMTRSSPTRVASGQESAICGGANNGASGSRSFVGGGVSNVAAALRASVVGGDTNTASAADSAIGGGAANLASGIASVVAGGDTNVSSGLRSWIPGGARADTRGMTGRGAWASSFFATQGDAQSGEFVLRRITTDATATRLTGDGAAPGAVNTVNLPNAGTHMLQLLVTAQQTAGSAGAAGDCAGWVVTALIRRGAGAGSTVLAGASGGSVAPTHADAAATAWRLGLAADTANGGLAVSATGEANKTIRWVARVLSVETTA
ncbi:glycosyl hydrolase family 28-related protein [Roseococcus sp. SYP-B2431]|uniref:glycosyl hydrolase family 28-related protein n=1 Tax=Roseococcus sp. SYP-B2431 TaxID=2496640 RepID=UPI00197E9471|nr:glycosyl hydrolase family 28-related protein [Roseococcus sp. SYP-B2431]